MEPAENKPFIRETIEEKPRMSFGKKLLLTVEKMKMFLILQHHGGSSAGRGRDSAR